MPLLSGPMSSPDSSSTPLRTIPATDEPLLDRSEALPAATPLLTQSAVVVGLLVRAGATRPISGRVWWPVVFSLAPGPDVGGLGSDYVSN